MKMLYPELETYRDFDAVPEVHTQSRLQKNCGQIFIKGPVLTKEILEKVNAEIVPKKTLLCGREINTRRFLKVSALCFLLTLSAIGTVVAWFTDTYDNFVYSYLVLKDNNSETFETWQNPSAHILHHIYLFNYTNVDDYRNGWSTKLRVKELGPYVYEQELERVNYQFYDNSTLSYQDKRSFEFRPELSKGKQSDQVVVPNIPLLVGAARVFYENYFARLAFSGVLTGFDQKAFLKIAAGKFITGYNDDFYELAKTFSEFEQLPAPEKMGILSGLTGIDPNVYTIHDGTDVDKIYALDKINGNDHLEHYSTKQCNRIDVSTGALYSPKRVQKKQNLEYYFPQICRTMPLVFDKETKILKDKIPAFHYTQPDDIFDSADEKVENQCYCSLSGGECPLKGLFNASACNFGIPIFISHPHFRGGDPALLKDIDGLQLDKHKLKTFINIHPFMGFAMSGRTVMQINIQVKKAYGVNQMEMFHEDMILPLVWFDTVLSEDHLPQKFRDVIHSATFTVAGIRLALKYGTLLTAIVTSVFILLIWRRNSSNKSLLRCCRPTIERTV